MKNVDSNFILVRSGLFFILFSLLILNIGENIKKYRKNKFCRKRILLRSPALNNTTLINTLTKIEIGVILLKAIGFDFSKNRQVT